MCGQKSTHIYLNRKREDIKKYNRERGEKMK